MPPPNANGETIDDVIDRLDNVMDHALRRDSRLGYFAVLYRNVTVRVKDGIRSGRFEDAERMERLDVCFAERYFTAYEAYRRETEMTRSWQVAFDAAERWRPIILQHLLVGMNAHINLDLGIAAAETCPGRAIAGLERDFREINAILVETLDEVQRCLGTVSPWMNLLDVAGGTTDELIARLGITSTRDWAWMNALRLAPLAADERPRVIAMIDRSIAAVGKRILSPGRFFAPVALVVRLAERKTVDEVVDALRL